MLNLRKRRGRMRVLLVSTPNYADPRYLETRDKFNRHHDVFHRHYVEMVAVQNKDVPFSITLIGFDGRKKHHYTTLRVERVLDDINHMPMGYVRRT